MDARATVSAILFLWLTLSAAKAEPLTVVGFDVESGGADPAVVDDIVAATNGVDV